MLADELGQSGSIGADAHHVLLVEDQEDTAEFIKHLLEQHGHRVSLARDGGQAQSTFVMRKPDFVILDLMLPGESGYEICERLKQSDESIPVLILSAIELEESRELAQRVGADGYLTKPFDPDVLVEQIRVISQEVWSKSHLEQPVEEKRVRFNCRCGKRFKVSPVHRGRTLTCPECGETVVVPRHE